MTVFKMTKLQDISYTIYYFFLPIAEQFSIWSKQDDNVSFYVLLVHFKQKLKITYDENFPPI